MPKRWKIVSSAQPLVFCFASVSAMCTAVAELYRLLPNEKAGLCIYRGGYYLAVHAPLMKRRCALFAVGALGECLGAGRVQYAFYAEHGRELSQNAVAELGKVLSGG